MWPEFKSALTTTLALLSYPRRKVALGAYLPTIGNPNGASRLTFSAKSRVAIRPPERSNFRVSYGGLAPRSVFFTDLRLRRQWPKHNRLNLVRLSRGLSYAEQIVLSMEALEGGYVSS